MKIEDQSVSISKTELHRDIYNPGQNISNKAEKPSKSGQDKKSLISTFAYFFNCYCQSLIGGTETGHWSMPPSKFEIFPKFSNFLRS